MSADRATEDKIRKATFKAMSEVFDLYQDTWSTTPSDPKGKDMDIYALALRLDEVRDILLDSDPNLFKNVDDIDITAEIAEDRKINKLDVAKKLTFDEISSSIVNILIR